MKMFSKPNRSSRYAVPAPPRLHLGACLSGGLKDLYHRISKGKTLDDTDAGVHTNDKGQFCPAHNGPVVMAKRYYITELLNTRGQSAVLVYAEDLFDKNKLVVIKILHTAYFSIGAQEAECLRRLAVADPLHVSHTVKLLNTFIYGGHYCMVFESLHPEPITEIFDCLHLPNCSHMQKIKKLTLQLLVVLGFLRQQNTIHADLKPENILLKHSGDLNSVQVIDFGNSIQHVHKEVSLYYQDFDVQTLLYRAPEVMFGIPFGTEIDMWSLGCILAELYLGKPLFFGKSKNEILSDVTSILGPLPKEIFQRGKYSQELEKYTADIQQEDATLKLMQYLPGSRDYTFANFLALLFRYDPDERLSPADAAQHPFLAQELCISFLLPQTTRKQQSSSIVLNSSTYQERVKISSEVKRQNPSTYDLLVLGTNLKPEQNLTEKHREPIYTETRVAEVQPYKQEVDVCPPPSPHSYQTLQHQLQHHRSSRSCSPHLTAPHHPGKSYLEMPPPVFATAHSRMYEGKHRNNSGFCEKDRVNSERYVSSFKRRHRMPAFDVNKNLTSLSSRGHQAGSRSPLTHQKSVEKSLSPFNAQTVKIISFGDFQVSKDCVHQNKVLLTDSRIPRYLPVVSTRCNTFHSPVKVLVKEELSPNVGIRHENSSPQSNSDVLIPPSRCGSSPSKNQQGNQYRNKSVDSVMLVSEDSSTHEMGKHRSVHQSNTHEQITDSQNFYLDLSSRSQPDDTHAVICDNNETEIISVISPESCVPLDSVKRSIGKMVSPTEFHRPRISRFSVSPDRLDQLHDIKTKYENDENFYRDVNTARQLEKQKSSFDEASSSLDFDRSGNRITKTCQQIHTFANSSKQLGTSKDVQRRIESPSVINGGSESRDQIIRQGSSPQRNERLQSVQGRDVFSKISPEVKGQETEWKIPLQVSSRRRKTDLNMNRQKLILEQAEIDSVQNQTTLLVSEVEDLSGDEARCIMMETTVQCEELDREGPEKKRDFCFSNQKDDNLPRKEQVHIKQHHGESVLFETGRKKAKNMGDFSQNDSHLVEHRSHRKSITRNSKASTTGRRILSHTKTAQQKGKKVDLEIDPDPQMNNLYSKSQKEIPEEDGEESCDLNDEEEAVEVMSCERIPLSSGDIYDRLFEPCSQERARWFEKCFTGGLNCSHGNRQSQEFGDLSDIEPRPSSLIERLESPLGKMHTRFSGNDFASSGSTLTENAEKRSVNYHSGKFSGDVSESTDYHYKKSEDEVSVLNSSPKDTELKRKQNNKEPSNDTRKFDPIDDVDDEEKYGMQRVDMNRVVSLEDTDDSDTEVSYVVDMIKPSNTESISNNKYQYTKMAEESVREHVNFKNLDFDDGDEISQDVEEHSISTITSGKKRGHKKNRPREIFNTRGQEFSLSVKKVSSALSDTSLVEDREQNSDEFDVSFCSNEDHDVNRELVENNHERSSHAKRQLKFARKKLNRQRHKSKQERAKFKSEASVNQGQPGEVKDAYIYEASPKKSGRISSSVLLTSSSKKPKSKIFSLRKRKSLNKRNACKGRRKPVQDKDDKPSVHKMFMSNRTGNLRLESTVQQGQREKRKMNGGKKSRADTDESRSPAVSDSDGDSSNSMQSKVCSRKRQKTAMNVSQVQETSFQSCDDEESQEKVLQTPRRKKNIVEVLQDSAKRITPQIQTYTPRRTKNSSQAVDLDESVIFVTEQSEKKATISRSGGEGHVKAVRGSVSRTLKRKRNHDHDEDEIVLLIS